MISIFILLLAFSTAQACGPFYPLIPTPDFFSISDGHKRISEFERDENLRLWQSLISEKIPLADIEQVIYKDSWETYSSHIYYNPRYDTEKPTDNLFYIYLQNSNDDEVCRFISLAKELEEAREKFQSPWYYPKKRNWDSETGDFNYIINQCLRYKGERLKDRYALQATRALFASRRYDECIVYADSAFAEFPEDNLMKRMAERYVAGCWVRLDEIEKADSIFAKAGDIWSISSPDRLSYMAQHNPNAPQIIEYLRSNAYDTILMIQSHPIAQQILKDKKTKNKGDWFFLLSFINNTYCNNISLARKQIYQAMHEEFSSGELRDLAHAYKMKLDALTGNLSSLLSDLIWIEHKTDMFNPGSTEWIRRLQNIVYQDWIPMLWNRKDYSTAILLCAYADNIAEKECLHDIWYNLEERDYINPPLSVTIDQMRNSKSYYNDTDYCSLSFQLMGILSSAQLESCYRKMMVSTPLYHHLRRKTRTDSDYYNELIGTLALREGNYGRAEQYLSRVSDRYLLTMNIYKYGYLSRDPFPIYLSMWESEFQENHPEEYNSPSVSRKTRSNPEAKLDFARKMKSYQHTIKYGKTDDDRGLAQLLYTIGRHNSFDRCWALTQYWHGWVAELFCPELQYWDDVFSDKYYSFLNEYDDIIARYRMDESYDSEIESALAMLRSDEAKAKAQYILGNLKTIVRNYDGTATAQFVKTSCDNWSLWL